MGGGGGDGGLESEAVWLGEAKVSRILRHRGVEMKLAYSWARPTVLAAGKDRGVMFLFHTDIREIIQFEREQM